MVHSYNYKYLAKEYKLILTNIRNFIVIIINFIIIIKVHFLYYFLIIYYFHYLNEYHQTHYYYLPLIILHRIVIHENLNYFKVILHNLINRPLKFQQNQQIYARNYKHQVYWEHFYCYLKTIYPNLLSKQPFLEHFAMKNCLVIYFLTLIIKPIIEVREQLINYFLLFIHLTNNHQMVLYMVHYLIVYIFKYCKYFKSD